jgi:hypothetical protein
MNTYQLRGRIDSVNAGEIEKEIRSAFPEGFGEELFSKSFSPFHFFFEMSGHP